MLLHKMVFLILLMKHENVGSSAALKLDLKKEFDIIIIITGGTVV